MSRMESVQYGTTRIEYAIKRTERRKTIGITVRPDQTVIVAAPKGTRRTSIAKKVRGKLAWIIRQRERNNVCRSSPHRSFRSGETLLYLGRQYQLKLMRTSAIADASIRCHQGRFHATVNSKLSTGEQAALVRKALELWYREHCKLRLEPCITRYEQKLGVTAASVEVREMKSRWGSASANGRIRFNWRIVMAPKSLFEYVVAHELCHLRHRSHSEEFWRLLSTAMPDHASRRQCLEHVGPNLSL